MLAELQQSGRVFTFLCGHDSNIGSVLAALETEDYDLLGTIENRTPIGCKFVIEKFKAKDGSQYADRFYKLSDVEQRFTKAIAAYDSL